MSNSLARNERHAGLTGTPTPLSDAIAKASKKGKLIRATKGLVLGLGVGMLAYIPTESPKVLLTIMFSGLYFYYKYRPNKLKVKYKLSLEEKQGFDRLKGSFQALQSAKLIKEIQKVEEHRTKKEQKYTGGASNTVTRKTISMGFSKNALLKSNLPYPILHFSEGDLCFLPDLVVFKSKEKQITERPYPTLEVSLTPVKYSETESLPQDAQVVGNTWKYIGAGGGPDKRFKDNKEIPICLYGHILFRIGHISLTLQVSSLGVADEFLQAIQSLQGNPMIQASQSQPPTNKSSQGNRPSMPVDTNQYTNLDQMMILGFVMGRVDSSTLDGPNAEIIKQFGIKHVPEWVEGEHRRKIIKASGSLGTLVQNDEFEILKGEIQFRTANFSTVEKEQLKGLISDLMESDGVITESEEMLHKTVLEAL